MLFDRLASGTDRIHRRGKEDAIRRPSCHQVPFLSWWSLGESNP